MKTQSLIVFLILSLTLNCQIIDLNPENLTTTAEDSQITTMPVPQSNLQNSYQPPQYPPSNAVYPGQMPPNGPPGNTVYSGQIPRYEKWPVPPPKVVSQVDLNRYIGKWYQQAWIPAIFQIGCEDSQAEYSLNQDGSIAVNNTCFRFGKQYSSSIGRARIDDSQQPPVNSKLLVTFPEAFGLEGEYWIVRLGEEYEYAVVSDSAYRYLWILSRQQVMPQQLYEKIVCDLAVAGFPVYRMQKTEFIGNRTM